MQTERPAPVLSAVPRHVKDFETPKAKQVVSAASVFTNAPHKARAYQVPGAVKGPGKLNDKGRTPISATRGKVGRRSSSSPTKKIISKQVESHPLYVDLVKATNGVRKYNYEKTATKLNETYNGLINQLHNLDVQPVSSSGNSGNSPLRLSLAGQVQRESQGLSEALGETHIRMTGNKSDPGVKLATRFAEFDDTIKEATEKIETLQHEWAITVGKIWQLGCQALGEDVMRDMLLPKGYDVVLKDSTSMNELSQDPEKLRKPKKRVSFREPLPDYFTFKTNLKPLDGLPAVPSEEVKELEKKVDALGATQTKELRAMEKEHQQWFSAKQKKIAQALQD
ncbi:hypothetical protein P154DRAFT_616730 [Amniculicola lignicola CBS 123094]|uniref:Uncharacterized protein n=1 Tax=Amniculicola lignicola CBS 123094 TaxID=1392246 RepID=A0A6A5WT29_9PLEO|nr:hypothetical protein P154DRAFT_616730 [Amniculicola lignicola CBS 123094]